MDVEIKRPQLYENWCPTCPIAAGQIRRMTNNVRNMSSEFKPVMLQVHCRKSGIFKKGIKMWNTAVVEDSNGRKIPLQTDEFKVDCPGLKAERDGE